MVDGTNAEFFKCRATFVELLFQGANCAESYVTRMLPLPITTPYGGL
jgi:hypothetical protein